MFKVVIQFKELEGGKLAINVEPSYPDGVTKLERGAAEVLRLAVDRALSEISAADGATTVIDIEDAAGDAWRRKFFGG